MKRYQIVLIIYCWFVTVPLFAQTTKTVEADLLKSFNRIDYWDQNKTDPAADDSLQYANNVFSRKLQSYTEKYPFTITQSFKLLAKAGLRVNSSSDGLFRIYCWDTYLGGTMRQYKNLAQYKSGAVTKSIFIVTDKNGFEPFYSNVYTIKKGDRTYYLGVNMGVLSSAYIIQGVKIFAVEQGVLDLNAKLIKTKSGLHNRLDVDSDLSASVNKDVDSQPKLSFNPDTQVIHIPLITAAGKITSKFITYKFTGQYFEKVVNLAE